MGVGDITSVLSQKTCDKNSKSSTDVVGSAQITALHIALWNGSLSQIESSLQVPGALEAKDPRGHRALHLALKFAHRHSKAIVKRLLAGGARVRSRDAEGWKAVHHAVASESEEILSLLIQKEREQGPQFLYNKICDISPQLNQVPDFYCELLIDVSTWLPGVSHCLPSDVVKIWKCGPDLRFDITLIGFENGSWQRDHNEGVITDLVSAIRSSDSTNCDNMVHSLMTKAIVTTSVDASQLVCEHKKSWLTKSELKEDIGTWKHCDVFEINGIVATLRIRQPQNKNHELPKTISADTTSATVSALSVLTQVANDSYTEVVIDPKKNHVVSIELADGEQITWMFQLEAPILSACDIGFGVQLLSQLGCREQVAWDDIIPMQRLDANGGKKYDGSFTAKKAGTIVFTWDNSYSMFRQKRLRFHLQTSAHTNGDNHRASEQLTTFEEWFGLQIEELPPNLQQMAPKQRIMVHTQPCARTISKSFSVTMYTTTEFPLSVHEFLPVIEILLKTTNAFENIQQFFSVNLAEGFPVQFCFPLIPSISATCRFETMLLETPDPSMFEIPQSYIEQDETIRSDVLDELNAV